MTEETSDDIEMREADWEEVYTKQQAREAILPTLADRLGLDRGDTVVELGSGPGFTALTIAAMVRPGQVYAIDRHPDALGFLREKATEDHIDTVEAMAAEAQWLPLCFQDPVAVLAAFMLHHTPEPSAVLAELSQSLPAGSRVLVVEYEPEAPGDVGPALEHRIAPTQLKTWLETVGFSLVDAATHPEEKYSVLARR